MINCFSLLNMTRTEKHAQVSVFIHASIQMD